MKYVYAIAAAALMLGACHKKEKEQNDTTPEVEVASPAIDSVTLHRSYPGYIRAANSADVVARVSGQLLTQNYKDGDYVTKGQVLFTIEPSKYRDAVEQAQAALQTAESEYAYASRQYDAMKKAIQADAVSEMEVLQSQNSMNSAKAAIRNAKAALATARENLGYCTVRATRSGHCSLATVSTGNYLNGEGSPVVLATIYDDSEVKAVFEIEDAQYEMMMNGNKMTENKLLRAIPLEFQQKLPHSYTADLSYVSPNVGTDTGTIELEGHLANPYQELKDGMYVSVSLPYGTDPKAVVIRDASIGTDQLGKYVYVVNDSDKVVYTPIEVGELYRDSLRIVTKGLTGKELYVTKALLTVRNGEIVKPVKR
ncbi:MAG: efflux RND transporter periplasmic adaptor subunit [Muribaculaceae bacterium]|nr:efflux RND transporter periplasmic adaptor subunit [Muribaculaceae bacterium]